MAAKKEKSAWCEFYYFLAVILGANSLSFWKSAVNTLIYMKVWKTKFPIFGSIRLKISGPVTFMLPVSHNILRYTRQVISTDLCSLLESFVKLIKFTFMSFKDEELSDENSSALFQINKIRC